MNNNQILKWLIIFIVSTSLIIIPATGLWAAFQPGEVCLGNKSVGVMYFGAGFFIIIFICCFWCGCCNTDSRGTAIAATCSGLSLFLFIICVAVYGLIRSTIGFAWLEKEITSNESWMDIKHCLYQQSQVCAEFQRKFANDTADQFFARHFTPTESGCCRPPKECNFNFSSPTVWMEPGNGTGTYSNADCYKWDNDPKKLCYNCQVCKHGLALNVRKTWSISSAIVIVTWIILASAVTFTFITVSGSGDRYSKLLV